MNLIDKVVNKRTKEIKSRTTDEINNMTTKNVGFDTRRCITLPYTKGISDGIT